jgi:hypothetical protein
VPSSDGWVGTFKPVKTRFERVKIAQDDVEKLEFRAGFGVGFEGPGAWFWVTLGCPKLGFEGRNTAKSRKSGFLGGTPKHRSLSRKSPNRGVSDANCASFGTDFKIICL